MREKGCDKKKDQPPPPCCHCGRVVLNKPTGPTKSKPSAVDDVGSGDDVTMEVIIFVGGILAAMVIGIALGSSA